jgi:hypothetical protein
LTAQVKALRGDLDRRVEQFSGRFTELGGQFTQLSGRFTQLSERTDRIEGRLDALSVKEKFSLPFSAELDRDWVGGTTNPAVSVPFGGDFGPTVFIARGKMPVALPDLSRIQVFSASVRVADVELHPPGLQIIPNDVLCRLTINLERIALDTNNSEPVVQLLRLFVAASPDPQAVPNPGREFVDNDRFTYVVSAEFTVVNPIDPTIFVPAEMVVLNSFQVDCVGA